MIKDASWKLVSAASLQKKFPHRYLRPTSSHLLGGLKKGNIVQLLAKAVFTQPKSIQVKFIDLEIMGRKDGKYFGRLLDQTALGDGLEQERFFAFRPEHVLSVETPEEGRARIKWTRKTA